MLHYYFFLTSVCLQNSQLWVITEGKTELMPSTENAEKRKFWLAKVLTCCQILHKELLNA